ncbi:hypothetical protein ACOSQ2_016294 [Xanthoceras sorbifolium]
MVLLYRLGPFWLSFRIPSSDPSSCLPNCNNSASMKWTRPPTGCFKLNTDAATDFSNNKVGLGAIIRNDLGRVMVVSAARVDSSVPVDTAEALAIIDVVQLALEMNIHPIQIESDSKGVMDLLNGLGSSRTTLGLLVDSILCHPLRPQIMSFSFSPRASNAIAHALFRLALSLEEKAVWKEDIHDSLFSIILADCHGSV